VKKFLIIRFSSIGDIVLTTPMIRCIKTQFNCELHFLTKKEFSSILINNPYIDKLFAYDNNLKQLVNQLKAENYDYIIDLHNNIRSHLIKFRLFKPYTCVRKLNFLKWLIVNFKINLLPKVHIVDRYFDAAKKLNIANDNAGLDYFISKTDEIDIKTLPESHQCQYIAFVIGAKHFTKQIPINLLIEICKQITKPIILLGDKQDEEKGNFIHKEIGQNIYNACGKYSLNQSAFLIKNADKVVTADTGLMHIAAAFNKKTISLWGNTIPAFGMYPYMPKNTSNSVIFENNNLKCRPCSKLGYQQCPKKHFNCMNQLNVIEIINIINND